MIALNVGSRNSRIAIGVKIRRIHVAAGRSGDIATLTTNGLGQGQPRALCDFG